MPDHNDSLQYQVHVQNIGWMDYVSGGEVAGTTGQAKRIEAIRIQLLGNLANTYNVIYRTHVQNYGWMTWVMNNSLSGTTGQSLRIEAIEILLALKNGKAPSGNNITYDAHVQSIGWQSSVGNGQTAGTTGQAKRVEAFHISLKNQTISGQILYQAHVAGTGWQDWVTTGELAGTTGQSRQIEAIRIKLNNDLAERYDIYYRVHAQGYGWLTWTCDGLTAGTTGLSKRIEALQIRLVARENEKPENDSSISAKPAYISSNQVVTNIDQSVNFTMADKISTLLNKSGWTLRGSYDWIVNNIKYQHMVSNAALGSDWYAQYGYNHKSGKLLCICRVNV